MRVAAWRIRRRRARPARSVATSRSKSRSSIRLITLTGATELGSSDPAQGRVRLFWVGSVCDSRATVTIAADLRSITLDTGPRPSCDAMGVGREVVLDF